MAIQADEDVWEDQRDSRSPWRDGLFAFRLNAPQADPLPASTPAASAYDFTLTAALWDGALFRGPVRLLGGRWTVSECVRGLPGYVLGLRQFPGRRP